VDFLEDNVAMAVVVEVASLSLCQAGSEQHIRQKLRSKRRMTESGWVTAMGS